MVKCNLDDNVLHALLVGQLLKNTEPVDNCSLGTHTGPTSHWVEAC